MKKLLALFALLLSFSDAYAQRTVDERRAVVPNGFVRIFILNGSVSVKGWDKDSIVATGTVYEPDGERFVVGVTPKGAKISLWSDEQKLKPSNITIWVPEKSQVWVKTTDANISVAGVKGGLDLFSVSGTIDVTGAPAPTYAESMAGNITFRAKTSSARLKTAAGAIRVDGYAEDLNAVTVSGSIDVAKLSFIRARLESVDGDIRYFGSLNKSAVLEMINHAGGIELALPGNVSGEFLVSQYSGDFVDKLTGRKRTSREFKFATSKTPFARITMRTFKGRIVLRKF
ncbi:MAG TPA: DUF4097 family beta strand repeat-containing protein [Longimicrobiales bacterium]|nr:DUF4097 family beta strand repeat-containing protein [Longimicrobiales bacterium]